MLLSAVDPSLLFYSANEWQTRSVSCLGRMTTLLMHCKYLRAHAVPMILSHNLAALLYESYPWTRRVDGLRDLRRIVFETLGRAHYVMPDTPNSVSIIPNGLTASGVTDSRILDEWANLLAVSAGKRFCPDAIVLVATSEAAMARSKVEHLTIHADYEVGHLISWLPLVWNEESWAIQILCQNTWPDLSSCVEHYFRTHLSDHPMANANSIGFTWTKRFWKSVEAHCDPSTRTAFIKSIAKRVYGICDASLGDEAFGPLRRFRVTDFWRVHYRDLGDSIILEEFGGHDIRA